MTLIKTSVCTQTHTQTHTDTQTHTHTHTMYGCLGVHLTARVASAVDEASP